MSRFIVLLFSLFTMSVAFSSDTETTDQKINEVVNTIEQPLYTPFVERYVLDELKQVRIDLERQNASLIQQIVDREHASVDRAVSYATDTVTYFFYLVAGAASILVLVGWSSIHEAKARVQTLADEKISALIKEYESRLGAIEEQLKQKSKHIEENREEIELTQDIQALWLRAGQDISPANKIVIYDQILELRSDDCEALSYKADAVLDLGEPQWAINLCRQALEVTPDNSHALYQLACAHASLDQIEDSLYFLKLAVDIEPAYKEEATQDEALKCLFNNKAFQEITAGPTKSHAT